MTQLAMRFLRDDSGASAIEYAIVAAGIAVAIAAITYELGAVVLNNLYARIAAAVSG